MLDHMKFNQENYYPISSSDVTVNANGKTYREYKYQTITKTLSGNALQVISNHTNDFYVADISALDMNRKTRFTFSNGDSFIMTNYLIYTNAGNNDCGDNVTKNNYQIRFSPWKNAIEAYYYNGTHDVSQLDWVKIEINVD
ncbi:hypothetical protein [Lactobacillus crispatus]|uniref:hypothetical protein n=1 Tax=Lactobacillus crispatus TaxID=47770 RepID=UPI0007614471|nr:hypothetical protein [Lactobacillus crispatus]KWU15595.1 hypothetical protein AEM00_01805 [Lactobacillus crispatus]MYN47889.1 hypothetical protein [Lactobacillus crispatus]WAZ53614.1 hypothetical protein O0957_10985 [Lactobacillus crispatus]